MPARWELPYLLSCSFDAYRVLIKPQFVDFIVSKAARFSSVAECEISKCEIAYVGLKE